MWWPELLSRTARAIREHIKENVGECIKQDKLTSEKKVVSYSRAIGTVRVWESFCIDSRCFWSQVASSNLMGQLLKGYFWYWISKFRQFFFKKKSFLAVFLVHCRQSIQNLYKASSGDLLGETIKNPRLSTGSTRWFKSRLSQSSITSISDVFACEAASESHGDLSVSGMNLGSEKNLYDDGGYIVKLGLRTWNRLISSRRGSKP